MAGASPCPGADGAAVTQTSLSSRTEAGGGELQPLPRTGVMGGTPQRSAMPCQTPRQSSAVHRTQTWSSTVPPHLPCFLFTPALFRFANGFFIYFSCCCKLQGEQRRRTRDDERTAHAGIPLGHCWAQGRGRRVPPALPVPAASWPVWSLALRALVRIHHCQTLFRTLQKQTRVTLSSSARSRGHSRIKEPRCFGAAFAADTAPSQRG